MAGWIKIDRGIKDHWLWKDPIKFQWWIDIILTVNFKDTKINIGNRVVECKRGQSLLSLQSWADRWKVDKSKVRRFFVLLQDCKIINTESVQKTTLLTVLNYDSYQVAQNDSETILKRKRNDSETILTPIEEREKREEGKKGKKFFLAPQLFDVIEYFNSNGYSRDGAEVAFNYYDKKNWVDSKGNKVSNWKLKMQNVWFKDEYKERPKQLWVKVRLGSTIQDFIKSSYEVALRENKLNCNNPEIIKEYYK